MVVFKWKITACKYGRAWYTPFVMVDIAYGGVGIAFVALRWQIVIMRVHTDAYWKAQFQAFEKEHGQV